MGSNARLGIGDAEELAEWFLNLMPMEQRRKLMAERPLLYNRVFPGVKAGTILTHVADALDAAE